MDRDNMPYMGLWAIGPDGGNARIVYGNYTRAPHCAFEAKPIPGTSKIVFTASAHDDGAALEGRFFLADVYRRSPDVARGSIASLRIKAVPAKTHPTMNFPNIGSWPRPSNQPLPQTVNRPASRPVRMAHGRCGSTG